MAIIKRSRTLAAIVGVAAITLALAACTSPTPSETAAADGDPLGTPDPATGEPLVFGTLSLSAGPVTFPQVLTAQQAAVEYVNEYLGGINGRPIELITCEVDGTPAVSQRCANQILDENPVAIVGGTDVGSPGSFPVWEGADLAYIGGVPFTPVEQNSPNAVIFSSVSTADNVAKVVYAAEELGATSAALIYTSNTQGTSVAENIIVPTMEGVGIEEITKIPVPPTSSDVTSAVAAAVAADADIVYINTPTTCPQVLASLVSLGNQAPVFGIEPCATPAAIEGANGGAEGLFLASPIVDQSADTEETRIFTAAVEKYAPEGSFTDSLAGLGFQTIMNLHEQLDEFADEDFTTEKILAAFREGSDKHNFLGHPYTCDGEQLDGASAICNAYQQIRQIEDGVQIQVSEDWVDPSPYYTAAH